MCQKRYHHLARLSMLLTGGLSGRREGLQVWLLASSGCTGGRGATMLESEVVELTCDASRHGGWD